MSEKQTSCSVCGAKLEPRFITFTQVVDGQVFIVEDVPALVCTQCGETFLMPDTVDAVQAQLEHGQATEIRQVPVFRMTRKAS